MTSLEVRVKGKKSYPKALTQEQIDHAKKMREAGQETVSGVTSILNVHRDTLSRENK